MRLTEYQKGFAAALRGEKVAKQRVNRRMRSLKGAIRDLLDMLEEWDTGNGDGMSGFAGMSAVRKAQRLLGRAEDDSP